MSRQSTDEFAFAPYKSDTIFRNVDARLNLLPLPLPLLRTPRSTLSYPCRDSHSLLRHAASFGRRSEMLFFYLNKGSSLCYYSSSLARHPTRRCQRVGKLKRGTVDAMWSAKGPPGVHVWRITHFSRMKVRNDAQNSLISICQISLKDII